MTEESVSRAALMAALALQEMSHRACRNAVSEGAGFRVWSAAVAVAQLVEIYERRIGHLAGKGIASIGSERLVDRLRAVEADVVGLGLVHSKTFNFTLFLDPGELTVVACVVRGEPGLGLELADELIMALPAFTCLGAAGGRGSP